MMKHRMTIASLVLMLITSAGCSAPQPDTELTKAAVKSDSTQVRTLLANGAAANQKDKNGYTALMYAARNGDVETMKALIDAGADVNMRDCAVNGWTPLIHAIHKSNNQAVYLLLERGADVNIKAERCDVGVVKDGPTALMFAAGYDDDVLVRALLARGADPYAGSGGATVFSNAVAGAWDIDRPFTDDCQTATVKALLEQAPDLKLPDNFWGRSAKFFVKHKGCSELVNLLEQQQQSTARRN